MNQTLILYPAIAMFFLSIGCIFSMGLARFRAIHNREVKISFYSTYTKGSQPARLHLLARHVQNHFEVPPMFYAATILLYVTEAVIASTLVLAWSFFAARVLHTFIHLGRNNVSQRFFMFGFSLLCLTGLWALLLIALLSR
ncbi:MAG: hypothetical protein C9356_04815 [Oleiphilus sp.]|nr:MAG: hypothetical protein C9356_04815 [Oleiphilus sp.]